MTTRFSIKNFLAAIMLMAPALASAGSRSVSGDTNFSNPLFNTLLGVIIFMLIVIVSLSKVLKNLAQSDLLQKKNKEKTNGNGSVPKAGAILLFSLGCFSASAQNASSDDWTIGGLDMSTFYFMMAVILVETILVAVMIYTIMSFIRTEKTQVKIAVKEGKNIFEKLNASVEVEKESEIMLEHDYDGIRELDNDLPPWWKYGFYLTMLVAVVYLVHYHVTGTGKLQLAEYTEEVEKGKREVEEFMKLTASNVDENTVKMLGGADLEAGKAIFIANCAACHGKLGEGGVGPNLTDEYWMHSGGLKDVFKSIKYGWPDKGMKAWKEDLSPTQIAQLTSFIIAIKGTQPPNGKGPQGDLYTENAAAANPQDSSAVTNGTTAVIATVNTDSAMPLAVPTATKSTQPAPSKK